MLIISQINKVFKNNIIEELACQNIYDKVTCIQRFLRPNIMLFNFTRLYPRRVKENNIIPPVFRHYISLNICRNFNIFISCKSGNNG